MERDTPLFSHPQILSLVDSGILPTFTCFSLTDHTACPVGQRKYGECSTQTFSWTVSRLPKFDHFKFSEAVHKACLKIHISFVKTASKGYLCFIVIALKYICQMDCYCHIESHPPYCGKIYSSLT